MAKASRRRSKRARVLSSRTVYHGPVFWVTTDQVLEPGGVPVRRDIVRHSGSVVILAVDEGGAEASVLLARQYRHAAERYLWELPAGRIDKRENEVKAAKRELREETGYRAARWDRILHFWASPGFLAEAMSIYRARGLRQGTAQPEPDEIIEAKFFGISKAVEMILNGSICDAKTICGVFWLANRTAQR
jgi:ADP-ribose pyrophosphatase